MVETDDWDKKERGEKDWKKYDPTSLNIPILSSVLYCPICKERTGATPASFYIDSLQLLPNSLCIYIIHMKCHETFNVNIKIESISTILEGEVIYVK